MERVLLILVIFASSVLEMAQTERHADGGMGDRAPVWLPAPCLSP